MKSIFRGAGLLTCFGKNLEEFCSSINEQQNIFQPFRSTVHTQLDGVLCGQISGFDISNYYSEKVLANADRATSMAAVAAKLALVDAEMAVGNSPRSRLGITNGTRLSIATSMADFYESVLTEGARHCRISWFPNTVMNAPAGRIAILEGITGANTTVSSGVTSGLDAIGLACLAIEEGLSDLMICGGVEILSEKLLLGLAGQQNLVYSDYSDAILDQLTIGKATTGLRPAEGAVMFLIGKGDSTTNGRQGCCVIGYEARFCPQKIHRVDGRADTVKETVCRAIGEAGISPDKLGCVLLGTSFDRLTRQAALNGVCEALGDNRKACPVLYPQRLFGECGAILGPQCVLMAQGYFTGRLTQKTYEVQNLNSQWCGIVDRKDYAAVIHFDASGHITVLILHKG